MTAPRNSRLAVLMATWQGETWIEAQLESFAAQTRRPDLVLSSDDGSRDATVAIQEAFARRHPELPIHLLTGSAGGAAGNFLSLIRRTPEDVDRISLSDQDDVWLPGKLARASAALDAAGDERPVLYCARVFVCDETLARRQASRCLRRGPSFLNALTQNVCTGNTIVLNRPALDLARAAAEVTGGIVVHDWWLYQIVTGAGGRVIFDEEPQVLYRQHGRNLIGANAGLVARARRMRQLWSGVYGQWNDANLAALTEARHLLTPANAALVARFAALRSAGPVARLAGLRRLGLHRQGMMGQMSLYGAAALGKI